MRTWRNEDFDRPYRGGGCEAGKGPFRLLARCKRRARWEETRTRQFYRLCGTCKAAVVAGETERQAKVLPLHHHLTGGRHA